jgi:MFS family permease
VPRLSEPFASAEFRGLWMARALSLVGDQLARVALAILVFDRTGSAAWTGVVYALTYLPYLAGPVLAGTADRRSRRGVMITLDLARAALVGLMAVHGMPLPAMCVLLFVATAVSPVYDAARSATLPDVLTGELYPTGIAIFSITTEAAQIAGFACGGLLVAAVGPRPALALDALTYAVSAAAVGWVVQRRAVPPGARDISGRAALRSSARFVFGSPWMRALLTLAWLNALWIVPEGLAAPYAHQLHAGPMAVGALLAMIPAGGVLGASVLARFADHELRLRLMRLLALIAALSLVACLVHPGLVESLVLWLLCGIGASYNMAANAAFVQGLPAARRAQCVAVATTGMVIGQGLAVLGGGLVASVVDPATVVGGAGVVGVVVVALLSLTWLRRTQPTDRAGSIVGAAFHDKPAQAAPLPAGQTSTA